MSWCPSPQRWLLLPGCPSRCVQNCSCTLPLSAMPFACPRLKSSTAAPAMHAAAACSTRVQHSGLARNAEAPYAGWQEYASLDFLRSRPLHSTMLDRCVAWAEGRFSGMDFCTFGSGRLEGGPDELLLAARLPDSPKI